jgi:hypothetical protein
MARRGVAVLAGALLTAAVLAGEALPAPAAPATSGTATVIADHEPLCLGPLRQMCNSAWAASRALPDDFVPRQQMAAFLIRAFR